MCKSEVKTASHSAWQQALLMASHEEQRWGKNEQRQMPNYRLENSTC